jgi:ankyrin repeat protein
LGEKEDFFEAVKSGDFEKVKLLVEKNPSFVNAMDDTTLSPVLTAAYHGEMGIANYLVANGAKMDIFSSSALGLTYIVKNLVQKYPKMVNAVAIDGFQPLGLACYFGRLETAQYLVLHGAEVNSPAINEQRVTPLHSAVAGRHFEVARLLLANGADANAEQQGGFTALHAAAQNGQIEMIQLLLANGAKLDARTLERKTPADLARERGHAEALSLLGEQG